LPETCTSSFSAVPFSPPRQSVPPFIDRAIPLHCREDRESHHNMLMSKITLRARPGGEDEGRRGQRHVVGVSGWRADCWTAGAINADVRDADGNRKESGLKESTIRGFSAVSLMVG
jgi:hypothetical protein